MSFNPFDISDLNDEDIRDPDLHYFNEVNSNAFDSPYLFEEETEKYLYDLKKYENLSLIHINIRSMNSNFEKLWELLVNCSNSFNVICITETWSSDKNFKENSNNWLPNLIIYNKKGKQAKRGAGY